MILEEDVAPCRLTIREGTRLRERAEEQAVRLKGDRPGSSMARRVRSRCSARAMALIDSDGAATMLPNHLCAAPITRAGSCERSVRGISRCAHAAMWRAH